MYLYSDATLAERGVAYLPRTLRDAVDALAADPLAEQVLGPLMRDTYVAFKRDEWDAYHSDVSDWERERYLTLF